MRRILVALSAVGLAVSLASCGDDTPDLEACETAMRAQLEEGMSSGSEGAEAREPAECQGVPKAELERIAGELVADQLNG